MSEWSPLDRALRDLAQSEPPRHLHARVLARIGEPEASGWPTRWNAAWAVPSMIAVALVVALWMSRAPESVPPLPSVSLAPLFSRGVRLPLDKARGGQPDRFTIERALASQVLSRTPAPLPQPRRAPERQVETMDQRDPESSIPAHERPEPIAIAAISPAPVDVSPMEPVSELTIAPLSVDPLAVPDSHQPVIP